MSAKTLRARVRSYGVNDYRSREIKAYVAAETLSRFTLLEEGGGRHLRAVHERAERRAERAYRTLAPTGRQCDRFKYSRPEGPGRWP